VNTSGKNNQPLIRQLLPLSLLVFLADYLTKWVVVGLKLPFRINTGGALSIFSGWVWFYDVVSIVFLITLAYWVIKQRFSASPDVNYLAMAMIIGGAFGNLFDRFIRGGVVDFLAIGPFPTFNLADLAITTGLLLIITWPLVHPRSVKSL
jgi:signal peptidase II